MLYRDVSDIDQQSCSTLSSSGTITTYSSNRRKIYEYIGNKYVLRSENDGNYSSTIANSICLSNQQLTTLQSDYDFITPVYHTIGIFSFLFIVFFAYRLLIYPFFRSKL